MRRAGGAFVALLVWAAPAAATRKPIVESAASAPAWLAQAAARQVPGSMDGVDSLVLHDETVVAPLPAGGVRFTRRWAERVVTPRGMGDAASYSLVRRKDDVVEKLDAWNILPDKTMRRPDPREDIVDLPYTGDSADVDDARVRRVDAPGVMVGSVVGYESVVVEAIDRGASGESYGSTTQPAGFARLALEAPAGWEVSSHVERGDAFTRTEGASSLAFAAESLQPPPREDWPPPAAERLPRLWVRWRSPDGTRGFRDWDEVARWHRRLSDPAMADLGEAAAVSARLKPADAAALPRALREAFAFASRDVRYVSIQMGIGGYKPQTPAFTCSNRYGDCKAKSFLMKSLVEPWGLAAYPVLVLTRDEGRVLPEVPTPGQFNHCIVAIKLTGDLGKDAWNVTDVEGVGRLAILDPTTSELGPWQLRPDDQGTTALLVLPDGGRLIELPVQPPSQALDVLTMTARLDERGQVAEGTLRLVSSGTSAGDVRMDLAGADAARARDHAERLLQLYAPAATLVAHEITGLGSMDGETVHELRFTGGRLAQRAGDMLIVQPPSLVLPVPSARLPPPPRLSRLELGLPEEWRVEVTFEAPPGWRAESLPAPARRESPWFTLDRAWEAAPGGYVMRGTGRQLATSVPVEDYERFRNAAREANGVASEGIVLVKAPVTPPG